MKSKLLALSILAATMTGAQAATDIAPITAAQTDALAVLAAMLALAIAVWGAKYVRRFFR
jgi:hypothetical protein